MEVACGKRANKLSHPVTLILTMKSLFRYIHHVYKLSYVMSRERVRQRDYALI